MGVVGGAGRGEYISQQQWPLMHMSLSFSLLSQQIPYNPEN